MAEEDTGTSLIELVVGMAVLGIFMAIVTGALVSMTQTAVQVEAVTTSATQVDRAFLELDKVVRYADAITPIDESRSGDWYVGLETGRDAGEAVKHRCVQLMLNSSMKRLQVRDWQFEEENVPSWRILANNIQPTSGSDPDPFTTSPVPGEGAASTRHQQLTVSLTAGSSGTGSSSTSRGAMTFTALNSGAPDPSNAQLNADKCRPLPEGPS